MSIHFAPPAIGEIKAGARVAAAFESAPHEPDGWIVALQALVAATGLRAAGLYAIQGGDRWPLARCGAPRDAAERPVLRVSLASAPEIQLTAAGSSAAIDRAGLALGGLTSVVAQAVRTQLTVEAEAVRLAVAMLRRAGLQPLVCGPDGALLHAPDPAGLRQSPLRLSGGRLSAERADEPALKAALRDAVTLGRDRVLLLGRDSEAPAVVDVLPALTGQACAFRPHALVLLRGRSTDAGERAPILKQLYGLTSAEASVALAVTEGTPLGEIAARRGVAASTVRAQVKTILAKVGVGRQVELVHRLAAIC